MEVCIEIDTSSFGASIPRMSHTLRRGDTTRVTANRRYLSSHPHRRGRGWQTESSAANPPVYPMGEALTMPTLAARITVDPEQCGGRPCVPGLRIRVTDVIDLLASGLSPAQVIDDLPDLELDDVSACLRFASRRLDHPIAAA